MSAAEALDVLGAECARAKARVGEASLVRRAGRVERAVGLAVESSGPRVAVGEECRLESASGALLSMAEVVGFEGSKVFTMPIDNVRGLRHGDRVVATGRQPMVPVGPELLGRVLDAEGRPIDGRPLEARARRSIHASSLPAMERPRVHEPMATGVRAIDGLITFGRGQRVGIFAGAGVGKSRLLGSIARQASDEIVVIALVGERNREVREFVEGELGARGLARSVLFVATSDESPLRRVRCALAATAAAEEFRERGHNVTLLMDSLTRVAMALREIGLSTGEPPSTKGYPPSVFAFLPRLLERAGCQEQGGALTGIYTVFVEGGDMDEPVADASRAILDGHVIMTRALAERAHYPAIDVLASASRVMPEVVSKEHRFAAMTVRRLMAIYRDAQDLVAIGAYRPGVDPDLDAAVAARAAIESFLRQDLHEASRLEDAVADLTRIAGMGASS